MSAGRFCPPRWVLAVPLAVLLLGACSPENPQTAGQRAAAIADSLAAGAITPASGDAGVVCGDTSPTGGVEAIATRELDSSSFAWRVRCVRRVAQRPATLRIDEVEEIVAWRDGNGANARQAEAVFVAVSHEPPADTADARGVWPLAAVLAALDRDSITRSVVVTLGAVSGWDVLDASAPDDTFPAALDSEYRNLLEARADSGPSPPLARPRQPGILIGLIPQSDLPLLSHDPQNRMLADGSVFGHDAWNVPDGVSLRTSGDMVVLGVADGVSAGDEAVLSDLTGVVVRALETVDEWTGPQRPANSLLQDQRTTWWLLGIVLPIVFLAAGTWCLLSGSLTERGNARRALRYTDAEVVRHLLWQRRTARRMQRKIARTQRRLVRTAGRIERLGRILEADDSSERRTARATVRLSKATQRGDRLNVRLAGLEGALGTALEEESKAKAALWDFAGDERHPRGGDDGAPGDPGDVVNRGGSADSSATGGDEKDQAISRVVRATWPTRVWLWVRRALGFQGARTTRHPRDRKPEFVDNMRRLASRLVCYRQHSDEAHEIQKKRGQDIVGGVWNGVWRSITQLRGGLAFTAGACSVIVAMVFSGPAVQLAADTIAVLESNPALQAVVKPVLASAVVFGVYFCFCGYEHGRAVVWGAVALTMLGLTTIEFTALKADLADVFDSQRVTVMQLVTVAMLFIGQEFGNRAAVGRKQKLNEDQEELAERLERARSDLDRCLGQIPSLEGVPDAPCKFKDSVEQAGARFVNPENREFRGVGIVTMLYLVICLNFVEPALNWEGVRPTGVQVHGDALNVAAVAGTVVLLPVFSLWWAWRAVARKLLEMKGDADD